MEQSTVAARKQSQVKRKKSKTNPEHLVFSSALQMIKPRDAIKIGALRRIKSAVAVVGFCVLSSVDKEVKCSRH